MMRPPNLCIPLTWWINLVFHWSLLVLLRANTPPTATKKVAKKTISPITLWGDSPDNSHPDNLIPTMPSAMVISKIIVPLIRWIHIFTFQYNLRYRAEKTYSIPNMPHPTNMSHPCTKLVSAANPTGLYKEISQNLTAYITSLHDITSLVIKSDQEIKGDNISSMICQAAHICVNCAHWELGALNSNFDSIITYNWNNLVLSCVIGSEESSCGNIESWWSLNIVDSILRD